MTNQTLYLRCRPGDMASRVLLSGDPARVDRIAMLLDDARQVSRNREFYGVTGIYQGQPVSVVSGGIGAPSTAIAIEELAQLGVKAIVRVGTMMGLSAPLGTVVLPIGVVRCEGTSQRYLPLAFPAIPDWRLAQTLASTAQANHFDVRLGLTATYDAFYPDMAPTLIGNAPLNPAEAGRAGVLSMDMESSLVFVLSMVRQIAAATMCLVTVQAEPHRHMEAEARAESDSRLVEAALQGLVKFEV
ncbi:MAG: nucleoside phosphorylase [Chloroflexota bacterium]|jgi:uridine phosphorylase